MERTYTFSTHTRLLRDSPQKIDFHIQTGDYFLHLATLVGVLEESLAAAKGIVITEHDVTLAKELRNDLRYVQANYTIVPRTLEDIEMVRPRGNLLPS